MREILFRGKDIKTGEWVYGGVLQHDDGRATMFSHHRKDKVLSVHEVIPETVGQYTELDDANGDKIFDGDILKLKTGIGSVITGIEWDRYSWERKMKRELGALYNVEWWYEGHDVITIIGNIFDNPELDKNIGRIIHDIDWSKVRAGTPILVRNHSYGEWKERKFAKLEDNWVFTYGPERAGWSPNNVVPWTYAKLKEDKNDATK